MSEANIGIKDAIGTLIAGQSLSKQEASSIMEQIMEGKVTPSQLGAFLVALRLKGETPEEIAGFASVMRDKSNRVNVTGSLIDIVGTGGDGSNTFNISTTAAFVLAGAGLKVAKHGNRAMSSRCGSADVLEALGIKIDLTSQQVQDCLENVGIGFMFAQAFHPAMKHAAPTRREIGCRTVFNILGPLTNPAGAQNLVLGVASPEIGDKLAAALCHLNVDNALIVHGSNGIDELSISDESMTWEIRKNEVLFFRNIIKPEDFGLKRASHADIAGGTPQENADFLRAVLSGKHSPRRDVVLINAAAGLYSGGLANSLPEAAKLAASVIDSGRAQQKLNSLIEFSSQFN